MPRNSGLSAFVIATGLVFSASCGGEQTRLVGTYNVGLAYNYVPYAESRQPVLMDALSELEGMDLLCLQEVWTSDDINAVLDATAEHLPHSFVEETEDSSISDEPACTEEEIEPLVTCSNEYCNETEDLVGCVLSFCGAEFDALSDECKNCAAANVGLGDVSSIADSCLAGSSTFAYDGHNGLALLGSQPFEDMEMLELDSWLNKRVLLYARIDGLHVGCTHLTARLSVTDYGGDLGSYKDEQSAQIEQVLDFMSARAGDEPRLLLGDFNTGPELSEVSAELPGNWSQLESDGWEDPNVNQVEPLCTWCASNSLTGGDSNQVIDHILVQELEADNAQRLFDQDQSIATSDGELDLPLSDHYGVQATIHY